MLHFNRHHHRHRLKPAAAWHPGHVDGRGESGTPGTGSKAHDLAMRASGAWDGLRDVAETALLDARHSGRQARRRMRRHPWATAAVALALVAAVATVAFAVTERRHRSW